MKKRDEIFKGADVEGADVETFQFNERVAQVFDDMVLRSVPHYAELQALIADLVSDLVPAGGCVCDLGCSTGNTIAALHEKMAADVKLVACDASPDMLRYCRAKLASAAQRRNIEFMQCDLNEPFSLGNPSAVIMCLVLQFIPVDKRLALLQNIHRQLAPEGGLVLVEKVKASSAVFNQMFTEWHEAFKRQHGYTELEIVRKREALENILVPCSMDENLQLMRDAGFSRHEVFFRWANFFGVLVLK